MKKFHLLFLAIVLGFMLTPAALHACETKSEKSCCKKEIAVPSAKKDCCTKSGSSKESQKECGGKCGHLNCTTSTMQLSLMVQDEVEFKNGLFDFPGKKQKFYDNETNISSGFYSVWLPPKIN